MYSNFPSPLKLERGGGIAGLRVKSLVHTAAILTISCTHLAPSKRIVQGGGGDGDSIGNIRASVTFMVFA